MRLSLPVSLPRFDGSRTSRPLAVVFAVAATTLLLTSCAAPSDTSATSASPTTDPTATTAAAPDQTATDAAGQEISAGNLSASAGEFPVRGLIFPASSATPASANGASKSNADADSAPVVIVSHLRAPVCTGADGMDSYDVPCPDGSTQQRYDQGMAYLGQALSELGYNVLIPDLTMVLRGQDVLTPDNQPELWSEVVSRLLEHTPGDKTRTGLVAHSRSAQMADVAVEKLDVDSIVTYGGFYETESTPARTGDVPMLALSAELDSDVGQAAPKWVSQYPTAGRITAMSLPGFGHMLINDNATDERVGCDMLDCADKQAHHDTLVAATRQWFYLTLSTPENSAGASGDSAAASDPGSVVEKLTEQPARVISTGTTLLGPDTFRTVSGAQPLEQCFVPEPMSPELPDNPCHDPEDGSIDAFSATPLAVVPAATDVEGAAPADFTNPEILLAPLSESGSPLTVTVTLADGSTRTVVVPGDHPALRPAESNSMYLITGIELAELDPALGDQPISSLRLSGDGSYVLRGVVGR